MEVYSKTSKVIVNSGENTTAQINMNGQQLKEVTALKFLGAMLTKDGHSTVETRTRLKIATASMPKLNKIRSSKNISFSTKMNLHKALVLSTNFRVTRVEP